MRRHPHPAARKRRSTSPGAATSWTTFTPPTSLLHLESVRRGLVDAGEYHFTTQQPAMEVRRRLFAAGFSAVRVSLLSLLLKPVRIAAIK